jgi:hypothetical protein
MTLNKELYRVRGFQDARRPLKIENTNQLTIDSLHLYVYLNFLVFIQIE